MVKAGNLGATIFYLKAKCGWRDSDPPGSVNVNLLKSAGTGDTIAEEKARAAKRRELLKLLTVEERQIYINLLRVAAERQDAQEGKPKRPAMIETTATPVPETQREGANSPASIPIPGAPFAAAK